MNDVTQVRKRGGNLLRDTMYKDVGKTFILVWGGMVSEKTLVSVTSLMNDPLPSQLLRAVSPLSLCPLLSPREDSMKENIYTD